MSTAAPSFYVAGGTLRGDAPSYVPRQADADLYTGLLQGHFCYVLTSRQMGKSSLMVRTAQRLHQQGVAVVVLDLTAVGQNLTAEQWYDGLLDHLGRQLSLNEELEAFWDAHPRLGPLQRWMGALREVVLPRCSAPLVIFIDEIDTVRSLPFSTDEFFAAIRECYNRRTDDAEFGRLTFCLLGVATPSDLIRDTRTTPFNIGRRIELRDFSDGEAAPLAQGLGRALPLGTKLLARVLYWTGGHPYLTQRLCQAVAEDGSVVRPAGVDRVCESLFLSHRARERDDNLLFVRERVLRSEVDRANLLDLYQKVRRRRRVRDDETSPLASILRLSGLTRVVEGYLWVRNRIYYRVFDREWVVANLPDAEKRRQKRAFWRGALRASLVATLVIAALGASIYTYFDWYVWDHVSYYNTFVKRWGKPEGVGPLTPAAMKRRAASFRFTRQGRHGPVLKVEAINGWGRLTVYHGVGTYLRYHDDPQGAGQTRECRWEYVYDRNDHVVYEKAFDRLGNLSWGFVYAPIAPEQQARGHFVDRNGYPRPQRHSSAEYVQIEYTDEGFEQTLRYFDRSGKRQPGLDNALGRFQEFDEHGLTRRMVSLDAEDRPMRDSAGNAGTSISYDERGYGNQIEGVFFDEVGKTIRVTDGYARVTFKYDEHGNTTGSSYFDEAGKPTRHKDGFASWTAKYGERGNRIEEAYFDEAGKPIRNKDGYARWTAKYDEYGNQIEGAYFDEAGKPTCHKDGNHRYTAKYDERNNQIEGAYLDEAGKPTLNKDGYAKTTFKYDERGNAIEQAYFDEAGKPIRHKSGNHRYTIKYDERGNQIEQAYFDEAGKPIRMTDGYARLTAKYDERGNRIEEAYFDEKGRPICSTDGYARWTAKYDERGNQIEQSYLDEEGKPIRHKDGYARLTNKYDERNNRIEGAYFDEEGKPTRHKDGYARWTNKYDQRGNRIEGADFDETGKPIRHKDGYASWTSTYDKRDNKIEGAYFDEAGRPTLHKDGYARWTAKYDERDNRIEQSYFDEKGRPTRHKDGYARWTNKYDQRGNRIEGADFDETGKPIRHKDGYARWTSKYDERDNKIEESYFDEEGKPIRHKDGYAKLTIKYDERGNRIEQSYFDEEGKPARHKDGNHRYTIKYDERGHQIEQAYFDEAGKPTRITNGYARLTAKYDERGNRIEEAYFDEKGKPVRQKDGFARLTAKYNERGNLIEQAYFDEEGKPTRHTDGNHRFTANYDEHGNRIEQSYFDEAGKPTRHKDGNHRYTAKYDEFNNQIEQSYFDEEGKPTRITSGYARWTAEYDARGVQTATKYFDVDNSPMRVRPVVQAMTPGGQGDKLGIKAGDILLLYDGGNVRDTTSFINGRRGEREGEKPRELVVVRAGRRFSFRLTPGPIGIEIRDRVVSETEGARTPAK